MKVIEQYTISKAGTPRTNEDRIFHNNHFAAIIDGATSKGNLMFGDLTTGQMACKLIEQALSVLQAQASQAQAINAMTRSLSRLYCDEGLLEHLRDNPVDRPAASVVMYSKWHHQVWFVGDCQALVNGQLHTVPKFVDEVIAEARSLYLHAELAKGKSVDELLHYDTGREYVLPLLKEQSRFQNSHDRSPYAYAVIDGFSPCPSGIKAVEVQASQLVLASDGYPGLKPRLAESEQVLTQLLQADPLLFVKYKSTKGLQQDQQSFDDRSFLRLQV